MCQPCRVRYSGFFCAYLVTSSLGPWACSSGTRLEEMVKVPDGFQIVEDTHVVGTATSSVACVQLQDRDGRAIVGFCPEENTDLTDLLLGRNQEASFAHFGNVSGLRERIALYIPCDEKKNAIKVCPGADALSDVRLDCEGPELLTARNRKAGAYSFDNAANRRGKEDCQISAPVESFSTGAIATSMNLGGPIDILFVVDNSGSMEDEQTRLAQGFERFVSAMPEDSDYRIAVVTTDHFNELEQAGTTSLVHSTEWPYEVKEQSSKTCTVLDDTPRGCFRGRPDLKIVDSQTMDIATQIAVFAENVQVGTCGSGFEQGLNAMMTALRQMTNACNDGFLREEAKLAIVFVSDEDDGSCSHDDCRSGETTATSVDTFVEQILEFKPYDQIRVAAVVGSENGEAANCSESRGADCGRSVCEEASRLEGSRMSCLRGGCPDNEICYRGECRNAETPFFGPEVCPLCAFYPVEDCCSAVAGGRYIDFAKKMELKIIQADTRLVPTACRGNGPAVCAIDSICQTDLGDTLARIAKIML